MTTHQPGARTSRSAAPPRTYCVPLLAFLAFLLVLLPPHAAAAAEDGPKVKLDQQQAAKGGKVTVSGDGWPARTLLMLLLCGENMLGGTNSCANADGRAVTTDDRGGFRKELPVVAPPKPCPCVVHVATVTGGPTAADAPFAVAGHPTAPLPTPTGTGKLAVLATTRLEGDSGVLVFFGAAPARRLVFTVGNLGTTSVKDPVFQVGTAHGVYAPQWDERQWRGTIAPGQKAKVTLPVELAAGAHGDYEVSVKYGGKVIASQPWGVGRPWGVTVFWVLLAVVVPAALFRIGMAVVDRVRPSRPARASAAPSKAPPEAMSEAPSEAPSEIAATATLPWFTPDSAPAKNRPTTKGPP
ncbi:hypothetical protein ACWEV4_26520 [Streptomyces sp. NPDC003860]